MMLLTTPLQAQEGTLDPLDQSAPPPSAEGTEPIMRDIGGQIFFDARQTGFNKDGDRQIFEGDVVAIGAGTLVAADKISVDRNSGILEASGRIVILSQGAAGGSRGQMFLGDSVTYHLTTGDFRIVNAVMLSNDAKAIEEVTNRVFGFTPREVAFEQSRQTRLQEIGARKIRLRREARRQTRGTAGKPGTDLVERYAVLLEQEELIKSQENPSLARLSEERREAFKRRRAFWDASRKSSLAIKSPTLAEAYFHLEGDEIIRTRQNDYVARNALFTPCRCEEGEAPAWAFRADQIDAQIGGYADLHHPVLEIKGIPILYLPHLTVPLKDRRQSGFLLPTFGFQTRSGNIYSQPVYFDLGANADATVTTDIYENRGTRLGLEYRIQQREFSGWDLRIEGMRDRLWMRDRAIRQELKPLYLEGLEAARLGDPYAAPSETLDEREYLRRRLQDPTVWGGTAGQPLSEEAAAAGRSAVDTYLAVPENTWRGAYTWRGVTFFAPRLSLVSNGEVASDHRYNEELYVPDDYQEAFFGGSGAKAFSTAKAQLHLDGKDYYVGVGTRFGDNYLADERFEGQQMPLRFKTQSRFVSLLPDGAPVPVYAQIMGENLRVNEFKADGQDDLTTPEPTLGDGSWRRLKIDQVSPLVTDRIVQVSQFSDVEARYVEHAGLDDRRSEIRSWRAGVEFRLPIDGKGELPESFQEKPEDPDDPDSPRKFVHHIMDWRLRFSSRPTVVKNGPYTDIAALGVAEACRQAYFASDCVRDPNSEIDKDVPEEERMKLHRRVGLHTDHVWKLFNRGWSVLPGEAPAAGDTGSKVPETSAERARRELLHSVDRPVEDVRDLYDETTAKWLVDRYRLSDAYYEAPLSFRGNVAYDFLDAKERERQKDALSALGEEAGDDPAKLAALEQTKKETVLAEPWKNPYGEVQVNYGGWGFGSSVSYSVYLRTATAVSARLTPPGFFDSNISLGYTVGKTFNQTERDFKITTERSLSLATSLIPPVITNISVTRTAVEGLTESYTGIYDVRTGFSYRSSSECWGLQFLREKRLGIEERDATYLLQLSVVFMGQQRGLPNMSPGVVREIQDDERGGQEEQR